ncbi:prolyl aminopeptidase [Methylophilaceae bacterium 11]|uniref:prolyl aminopeptidase n=1 Tax=Methylotenera sp. 1P/1 TaxID=1131551 RepID=UPI00037080B5|nr:prolyl aminopeptidase [Methylotenera sp. 1P/1]EUJ11488.1 prolyl aminopeptidase [Methylophilaceae bacterium 11]
MSAKIQSDLYPEIQPFHSDWLQVDPIHRVYFEQCGNPDGPAVIFLHGGPGSGCNPTQRRFFDPKHYHVILFDQRGCGRSTPEGEVINNTTDDLVADIEQIRKHLNIKRWHVFGGSWGSTLALSYACTHPSAVISLVLRGIFLSRPFELNWFLGQINLFFPDQWQTLCHYLPEAERESPLHAFERLVFSEDPNINIPAAIHWNAYESSIMSLVNNPSSNPVNGKVELARARVQIHYILHQCFVGQRDLLQEASEKLANTPTTIVQGRYDMVCPPQTAWELHQAMPHAQFVMVPDAGHSAMETGTCNALVAATNRYKHLE